MFELQTDVEGDTKELRFCSELQLGCSKVDRVSPQLVDELFAFSADADYFCLGCTDGQAPFAGPLVDVVQSALYALNSCLSTLTIDAPKSSVVSELGSCNRRTCIGVPCPARR